jgi:hypothetical protein
MWVKNALFQAGMRGLTGFNYRARKPGEAKVSKTRPPATGNYGAYMKNIHLPSGIQRFAVRIWPVTVLVLSPVIIAEAINLWRKNRKQI